MKPKTAKVATMTVTAIILIGIMTRTVHRNTKRYKHYDNALSYDVALEEWFG